MPAAAVTVRKSSSNSGRTRSTSAGCPRSRFWDLGYHACLLVLAIGAQSAAQTAPQTPPKPAPAAQNPAPPQPKPVPVTTTVIVHGEVEDNYLPGSVNVGTLDGAALKEAPLSATVVTRDLLNDQVSRLLSDVVQNDASVGDDYVPVGYYGVYQIRGVGKTPDGSA